MRIYDNNDKDRGRDVIDYLLKRTMKRVHNPCQRLSKRRNLKKKTATFIKFGQFSSRKRYHLLAPLGFKPIS